MNPEIIQFWKDKGFEIVRMNPAGKNYTGTYRVAFYTKKEDRYADVVGLSDIIEGYVEDVDDIKCKIYMINGNEFSEEEMLKVIRMAAFL